MEPYSTCTALHTVPDFEYALRKYVLATTDIQMMVTWLALLSNQSCCTTALLSLGFHDKKQTLFRVPVICATDINLQ